MREHHCRVCGLYDVEPPWGEDGLCPTYFICPCCGVEYGYEDYTVESTKRYRETWLKAGGKWRIPEQEPNDWNREQQVKCIPQKFV